MGLIVQSSTLSEPSRNNDLLCPVSAYWWRGVTNWGDLLTPLLLRRFAHLEAKWADPSYADIVCVGSVLGSLVKQDFTGVVLGSGKLFAAGLVPPKATILALRGPLTALGVKGHFVIGDPGLLADELVTIETKKYELGIVAHWSDLTIEHDPRFLKYDPIIIHASGDPLEVVTKIGECKKIVSSSLHGLIIADAFGIPRRFEPTAKWGREGGTFKVRDHCMAVSVPFEVGKTQQANSNRVADIKSDLWDAFATYGAMIRARS